MKSIILDIPIYDGPGKGRKQCQDKDCQRYVAARSAYCACGFEFVSKSKPVVDGSTAEEIIEKLEESEKTLTVYDEPGRGRKHCPKCLKYIGAKLAACPCGNTEFISKSDIPKEPKFFDEPGQGRKQCASCMKYIGAVLSRCYCGGETFLKTERVVEPKVINTYDEGGKGKKQCPNCLKYVGFVVARCKCDHEFVKKEKVVEIRTYDEPGRGRKQCAKCNAYVGHTAEVCVCSSTEFIHKETIKTYEEAGPRRKQCPACSAYLSKNAPECVCGEKFKIEEQTDVPVFHDSVEIEAGKWAGAYGWSENNLIVPAGKCPVNLKGKDKDSIQRWVDEIVELGYRRTFNMAFPSPSAFRYYLHQFYSGEDYQIALNNLNAIVVEKIGA